MYFLNVFQYHSIVLNAMKLTCNFQMQKSIFRIEISISSENNSFVESNNLTLMYCDLPMDMVRHACQIVCVRVCFTKFSCIMWSTHIFRLHARL